MQVNHSVWGHKWTRSELRNPEKNLFAGTAILKHYMENSKSLDEALHKYSGGAKDYANKVKRRMRG